MPTETLDKLYLEWAQFTKCRTAREIAYDSAIFNALTSLQTGGGIDRAIAILVRVREDWTESR